MRLASSLCLTAACASCSARPSDAELDRLLAETRVANEAATAEHGRVDERASWTLEVRGDVEHPVTLSWSDIEAIEPTEVRTRTHSEDALRAARPSTWRGPRLDALIDRAGAREQGRL